MFKTFLFLIALAFTHVAQAQVGAGFSQWCQGPARIAYCWGQNNSTGKLGNGTLTPDRTTPSLVLGGYTDWTKVSTAAQHSCGIHRGRAYCWGQATNGKLGNGTTTPDTTVPSLVSGGFTDWTDIAANGSTCGIRNGLAYCWGESFQGKLGNGTITPNVSVPTLVSGGYTSWTVISSGGDNTCGINAGRLYCWGDSSVGKLGNGTTSPDLSTPGLVSGGFTDWTHVSVNVNQVCGIRAGRAYCWGDAANGKLGNGDSVTDRTVPTLVSGGFTDWTDISTDFISSCGIRASGVAYCWGSGANGRLGDGSTTQRDTPSLVAGGFTDWTEIQPGSQHTCAIRSGLAYCWGNTVNGRVGDGNASGDVTTPQLVLGGFTKWISIAAESAHSCGIAEFTTGNGC